MSGTFRALGGFRVHVPALVAVAIGGLASLGAFYVVRARAEEQKRAMFNREATLVVSNLLSALERPLEALEASATLFEASEDVTRAEFASTPHHDRPGNH